MRIRRVMTWRWVLVHLAAVLLVAGFLLLGWWQITRAASGNALSFGYAIEWPVFAGFVIFVWFREVRKVVRAEAAASGAPPVPVDGVPADAALMDAVAADAVPEQTAPARPPTRRRRPRNEAAYDDRDDPDLAAYNHYLAWLNANPGRTPAQYPGMEERV